MGFNPSSDVVKLYLRAIAMEEKGEIETARELSVQAWSSAQTDLEKFISARQVAHHQESVSDRLKWLESCLHFASRVCRGA